MMVNLHYSTYSELYILISKCILHGATRSSVQSWTHIHNCFEMIYWSVLLCRWRMRQGCVKNINPSLIRACMRSVQLSVLYSNIMRESWFIRPVRASCSYVLDVRQLFFVLTVCHCAVRQSSGAAGVANGISEKTPLVLQSLVCREKKKSINQKEILHIIACLDPLKRLSRVYTTKQVIYLEKWSNTIIITLNILNFYSEI